MGIRTDSLYAALKPNPKIDINEWADAYRILPSESSAEPGRYRTDRMPYLREIAYELSPQSTTEKISVMKGTQLGMTELANNMIFTYADLYPCPMLIVFPTETLANTHAADKLWPSIEKTPRMLERIYPRKKDGGSKLFDVRFNGGNIRIGYSYTTSTFASVSRRVLIKDDLDRWPIDVKGEGSPSDLANKRTDAFPNRKIYANSSPTRAGSSMIFIEYGNSSQALYYIPCPECDGRFPFEFDIFKFDYDNENYILIGDVVCHCPHCGLTINEDKKHIMMLNGVWNHKYPEIKHKGYRLPSYYSPFLRWNEIFQEFLTAKKAMSKGNITGMIVWKNTRDANVWEDEYDSVNVPNLYNRCEEYGVDVPMGVYLLTAGVDTQDDRYEIEIVGHGKNGETWSIDFNVINGDPKDPDTSNQLDEYLNRTFEHEIGGTMKIFAAAIDTGGHRTKTVYEFCKSRYTRRIYAIKGARAIDAPITNMRASRSNSAKVPLFSIGVNVAKDDIYAKIVIDEEGAGYMHFPNLPQYDKNYFDQLTAEQRNKDGRWLNNDKKRNEAIDCRVYAMAAYALGGLDVDKMARPRLYMAETPQKRVSQSRQPKSHLDEY